MNRVLWSTISCVLFSGLAAGARADVIISNLPGDDGNSTFINAPLGGNNGGASEDSKAAGFLMPAGTDYTLDSVNLRLDFFDTDSVPVVALYNDSAGAPGTLLTTLTDPAISVGTNTFSFTPSSAFTLNAGSAYWVVVSNNAAIADSFRWLTSTTPGITPTGIAASTGYIFAFSPPPPSGPLDTTFQNSYSVIGTAVAVPEPGSMAMLLGMGLTGAGFLMKRRRR